MLSCFNLSGVHDNDCERNNETCGWCCSTIIMFIYFSWSVLILLIPTYFLFWADLKQRQKYYICKYYLTQVWFSQHQAASQPFDLQSPAIDIWSQTHSLIISPSTTHTRAHTPAPWGEEPCGHTSGFRRWRWGRYRGRGHTGRVWGSTAGGRAAAAPTRRWRCWQPETSAGSPSPGRYWGGTHIHI